MAQQKETIKVWPEMVLRETLSAIIATIVLLLVSISFDAPLETIADPSTSPNPAKAPWYFLGLQELLVYFPPWIAGVLIPVSILLGLAIIPYIDGEGEATACMERFRLEKAVKAVFTGGLAMWILLTVTGIFLRGPNWRLQWPGGIPLGANAAVMPLNWLAPAVTACYILSVLYRIGRWRENVLSLGLLRCLLTHAMILGGLIVTTKIVLYTLLSIG